MKSLFEYGTGFMVAEFPNNTDVFVPNKIVTDPPCVPEDRLVGKTLGSIRNPMGMEPLSRLAHRKPKVTIIFPNRIKGGEQPTSHRKISIKSILKGLYDAGVGKKDILLVCPNGLHRKNAGAEIHNILGDELFHEFQRSHQIINHDSEGYEHLVDLGTTDHSDPILVDEYAYDSDVAILAEHVRGNPYGGYSGGYKHCTTGIACWRSTVFHRVPEITYRKDSIPVSGKSLMRTKLDEIGQYTEKCMEKKPFYCNAVLDAKSRQIEINSGHARVMQPHS